MDRYGRKVGVIYCSVLSLVGGVCLCAAQNIAMFIVFRFFAGAGSWGFLALSTSPLSVFSFFRLSMTSFVSSYGGETPAKQRTPLQPPSTPLSSPLPSFVAFSSA